MSLIIALTAGIALLVVLARPRAGLFLMLFLVPLQNLFLIGNGATLIRYVGLAVFASWIIHIMATRKSLRGLFTKPVVAPLFVFLTLCLLSILWTDPGLWQTDMFTYLQMGMWVIILIDLINTYGVLNKALVWVFSGALIGAFLSIYEFFTKAQASQFNPRGRGGFDDPNYSSAIFILVLPYVFYRVRYSNGLQRMAWLGSTLILLSGVAFTVSRTGLLAIALVLAGQYFKYSKAKTRVKYIVLLVVLILITIPFWPWGNIADRFSIGWSSSAYSNMRERTELLQYGWKQFLTSPLFGNGLTTPNGADVIHNVFLSMAVKLGIFGFLAMYWLWLTTWRSLKYAHARAAAQSQEKQAELISALQLSALIYLFFSLALSTELSRPQWLLFALGSICWGLVRDRQSMQVKKSKQFAPEIAQASLPLSIKSDG